MSVLNGYQKSWLRGDVIAGVTVAAIAIPESLGYAKIAGLPIQTGLYCALLPALMFALIGSSRQLVVGADSATAALVAAGAGLVAAQGTAEYASAVGVLAILTAVFLLLFAVAKLEFLADLISQPVLAGFLSGVGVSLIIGNLSGMLGVPASGSTWDKLTQTLSELDQANWTTAALAFGTVIVMLALEEKMPKLPAALVSLTLFSVVAVVIDAAASGVESVGAIPAGLPGFTVPDFQSGEFATLAASAFSIAVVILAQSAAVARSFAQKNGYTDSVKGDLVGLSAANLASAFTSGFAINGSPPRTAAGDSSGSKGQVVNIAMAVTVALVLLFLTGLFEYIPSGVLDAVVFTIGIKLVKVGTLRAVGRTSRPEFLVAMVTLLVVAFVGVEQGIFLAIVLSLIDRLRRQYHPHDAVLLSDGKVIPRLESRVKLPAPAARRRARVPVQRAPVLRERDLLRRAGARGAGRDRHPGQGPGHRRRRHARHRLHRRPDPRRARPGAARDRRRAGPDRGVRRHPAPDLHHRHRRRPHRRRHHRHRRRPHRRPTPGGRSPRPTNPGCPHHKFPRGLIQGVVFRGGTPILCRSTAQDIIPMG